MSKGIAATEAMKLGIRTYMKMLPERVLTFDKNGYITPRYMEKIVPWYERATPEQVATWFSGSFGQTGWTEEEIYNLTSKMIKEAKTLALLEN